MTCYLLGCPTPNDLLSTNPSSKNESARLPPGFLITFKHRTEKEEIRVRVCVWVLEGERRKGGRKAKGGK